jgi:hypothetical protein
MSFCFTGTCNLHSASQSAMRITWPRFSRCRGRAEEMQTAFEKLRASFASSIQLVHPHTARITVHVCYIHGREQTRHQLGPGARKRLRRKADSVLRVASFVFHRKEVLHPRARVVSRRVCVADIQSIRFQVQSHGLL